MEAVTFSYSRDGRQWSKILGRDSSTPRVFPANFDSTTPVTQYLERMVDARYVRISPARWHASIGMRLELLGCYRPYSMVATTTALPGALPTRSQDGESTCSSCPGLSPPPQSCSCPGGALFDGARCVAVQECPCYVGQKRWRPCMKSLHRRPLNAVLQAHRSHVANVAGTPRVRCSHRQTVRIASVWEPARLNADNDERMLFSSDGLLAKRMPSMPTWSAS